MSPLAPSTSTTLPSSINATPSIVDPAPSTGRKVSTSKLLIPVSASAVIGQNQIS